MASLAERRGVGAPSLEGSGGLPALGFMVPGVQQKPILPSPQRTKPLSIPTPKFAFGRAIFIEKVKVRRPWAVAFSGCIGNRHVALVANKTGF
jgi:hypothetical protein